MINRVSLFLGYLEAFADLRIKHIGLCGANLYMAEVFIDKTTYVIFVLSGLNYLREFLRFSLCFFAQHFYSISLHVKKPALIAMKDPL